MNTLEKAVHTAIQSGGEQKSVNQAYLAFIKANFIVPVEKSADENVRVLFLEEAGEVILPVFSSERYLDDWAESVKDKIQLLKLSGVDLLKGVGQGVTIAFNIGSTIYKTFNSAEIERMRAMVLKFF